MFLQDSPLLASVDQGVDRGPKWTSKSLRREPWQPVTFYDLSDELPNAGALGSLEEYAGLPGGRQAWTSGETGRGSRRTKSWHHRDLLHLSSSSFSLRSRGLFSLSPSLVHLNLFSVTYNQLVLTTRVSVQQLPGLSPNWMLSQRDESRALPGIHGTPGGLTGNRLLNHEINSRWVC